MDHQPADELPEVSRRDVILFAVMAMSYIGIGIVLTVLQSKAVIGIGGAKLIAVVLFQVFAWPLTMFTH